MERVTKAEHIKWCKSRALEYLDSGDYQQAVTSMLSNLGKHEDTEQMLPWAGFMGAEAILAGPEEARKFIEGFLK